MDAHTVEIKTNIGAKQLADKMHDLDDALADAIEKLQSQHSSWTSDRDFPLELQDPIQAIAMACEDMRTHYVPVREERAELLGRITGIEEGGAYIDSSEDLHILMQSLDSGRFHEDHSLLRRNIDLCENAVIVIEALRSSDSSNQYYRTLHKLSRAVSDAATECMDHCKKCGEACEYVASAISTDIGSGKTDQFESERRRRMNAKIGAMPELASVDVPDRLIHILADVARTSDAARVKVSPLGRALQKAKAQGLSIAELYDEVMSAPEQADIDSFHRQVLDTERAFDRLEPLYDDVKGWLSENGGDSDDFNGLFEGYMSTWKHCRTLLDDADTDVHAVGGSYGNA